MGNITDDIRQHFDTFAELPFTEADSLALSQLAYARMPDNVPRYHENAETADGMIATVPIHDLLRAECYDDMFGKVWSPSMNVDLLRAMSESPRWRNLRVGAYVDEFDAETTKQFSACVFELGNGTLYVAFRGTDSSIVGWKEDFMMAFRRPVASQEAAARYLTELAGHWAGPIMVGGHSKGGNLAVYAAANVPSEIQERITVVYSHDGPGFDEAFFDEDGYVRIASKIHKSVPGSSIIGMLFETREHVEVGYTVVSSDGAATYTVPNTGQCTVTFKICAPAPNGLQCDTATLTAPVTPANVTASVSVPATAAPGSTQSGSITCTNAGPGTAFSATCAPSITDSTGAVVPVAGLTCSPSTPADLGLGVAINCRFSYTMPGTAGGSDTAPTGVTVVATAGAKNDTTTSDNTATGTTALVDAVDVKVDQPAGSLGHINLKTLSGVTAPAGSTFGPNPSNPGTCGSIRIDPATGMASLIVPTEGSCTVTYQICAPAPNASQCDAATVTVNAWTPVSVPTLGEWARAALGLLLAVFGAAMSLRQHRA